jgi:hypothetical protein
MRLAAGFWAALRNRGEVGKYPGIRGKLGAALALMKGDIEALTLIPRMLGKRRDIERIRKLSPRAVRQLILEHRISLKELTEQAN